MQQRKNSIMVIGAGIVGTATGKGLIKKGYNVVFVDKNPNIIRSLKDRLSSLFAGRIIKL